MKAWSTGEPTFEVEAVALLAVVSCAAEAQGVNACTSLLQAIKVVPEDKPSKLMACRAGIASLADQRRKLVESERKSYREAQEILPAARSKPSSQDANNARYGS